jgi:hypothetical protein
MIQAIHWQWYITASVVFLAVYYATVILLYYRENTQPAIQRTEHITSPEPVLFGQTDSPEQNVHPAEPDLSGIVHDFVNELEALLLQSEADQADKPTLSITISRCLQKYPRLKGSVFQSVINNLIGVNAENQCCLQLYRNYRYGILNKY